MKESIRRYFQVGTIQWIGFSQRDVAEATLIQAIDEAEYFGTKGIAFLADKYLRVLKEEGFFNAQEP